VTYDIRGFKCFNDEYFEHCETVIGVVRFVMKTTLLEKHCAVVLMFLYASY